jgi:hypothetical protein
VSGYLHHRDQAREEKEHSVFAPRRLFEDFDGSCARVLANARAYLEAREFAVFFVFACRSVRDDAQQSRIPFQDLCIFLHRARQVPRVCNGCQVSPKT